VIPLLQKALGIDKVFDLQELNGPEEALKKFQDVSNMRVIACGGDGTIRWVIQGLINMSFSPLPPVGVLPLGTGNDLSRMFGWGAGYNGENLDTFVEQIEQATSKPMDMYLHSLGSSLLPKLESNCRVVGH
jgi:diacylglycerol kinase (ATP)